MLNLPDKIPHTECVEMSRNDRQLYQFFKRFSYLTAGLDKTSKKKAATNILVLISMLRLICDHGEALLPDSALTAWRNRDENALTWEMLESTTKRVHVTSSREQLWFADVSDCIWRPFETTVRSICQGRGAPSEHLRETTETRTKLKAQ
ncbi:hypothetical protein Neosp_013238 [[Neocosmospora] mangrovei]